MAEGKKCISWDQPAEKGKVQSRMRPARHFNSAHGPTVAISGPWTMVHCAALTVGLFIILCNAPWSSSHPKYDPPAHSVKADIASDQKGSEQYYITCERVVETEYEIVDYDRVIVYETLEQP